MDDATFDDVARLVVTSRRAVLLTIGAAVLGAAGAAALGTDAVGAKKRGGHGKHHRCQPKPDGSSCKSTKDCCPEKTKRVCRTSPADLGMQKVCCGGEGASCGGPGDFCCLGFGCSISRKRCEREA